MGKDYFFDAADFRFNETAIQEENEKYWVLHYYLQGKYTPEYTLVNAFLFVKLVNIR